MADKKEGISMEKILIVVNPTSGEKAGVDLAEKLNELFEQKGIEAQLYETKGDDDFGELVHDAMNNGIDKVAVLGGDGTISEFTTQISNLEKRPEILLIPLGTTNNLARALNTELDMDNLLEKVKQDELVKKQADVGQVNDDYFISTLSAGSLPEVAWKTDDDVKEIFGSFGYVLEGITAINEDETFNLSIQTEAEKIELKSVALVVIGLSNSVFGIPTFFENGEIADGHLHLYALKDSKLMQEAASLAHHIFPNAEDSEEMNDDLSYVHSFKKASIHSTTDLNLAIDGEKGPSFPVELGILHKHLTFLVPEKNT